MISVSPVANLDSTETPVVNWGKVAVDGFRAGADIANKQAETRVSELRAQTLEKQIPVIAEQVGVDLYNLNVEKQVQSLTTPAQEAKRRFDLQTAQQNLTASQMEKQQATVDKETTRLRNSARITSPKGDLYKDWQSNMIALHRDGAEGFKKVNAWAKGLDPAILDTDEGVKLVADLQSFGTAQEVEVTYATGEKGHMTAYAADQQGLDYLTGATLSPAQKLQIDEDQKALVEWNMRARTEGIAPENIPSFVQSGMALNKAMNVFNTETSRVRLQITQRIQKIDDAGIPDLVQDITTDEYLNTDKIFAAANKISDPKLKAQFVTTYQAEILGLRISSLNLLKQQTDLQQKLVDERRSQTSRGLISPVNLEKVSLNTFVNNATQVVQIGDRTSPIMVRGVVVSEIEANISLVEDVLRQTNRDTPANIARRGVLQESRDKLIFMRNKVDIPYHAPDFKTDTEWEAKGKSIGSDINTLLGGMIKGTIEQLSTREREERLVKIHGLITGALPEDLRSMAAREAPQRRGESISSQIKQNEFLMQSLLTNASAAEKSSGAPTDSLGVLRK